MHLDSVFNEFFFPIINVNKATVIYTNLLNSNNDTQ